MSSFTSGTMVNGHSQQPVPARGTTVEWVRGYLSVHPSVRRSLTEGLLSYAATARYLTGESGTSSREAIAVALRRIALDLRQRDSAPSVRSALLSSEVRLHPAVGVLRAANDPATWSRLLAFRQGLASPEGNPPLFQICEGSNFLTVLVDEHLQDQLVATLPKSAILRRPQRFALAVVETGLEASRTPGVVSFLVDRLARGAIACTDAVSVGTEASFVVPPEEADRVETMLRRVGALDESRGRGPPDDSAVPRSRAIVMGRASSRKSLGRTVSRRRGPSMALVARQYVDSHPSVADCLSYGILNITELARKIARENGVGETEALEAALRRLRPRAESKPSIEARLMAVVRASRIELRTRVAVITARHEWNLLDRILGRGEDGGGGHRQLLQMIQSRNALTLLCEEEFVETVLSVIGPKRLLAQHMGLAAVTVRSPATILETPGVLSFLSEALAEARINLVELMSVHTDSTFVVRQADSLRAFRILSELIHPEPDGGPAR